jgi:hypothetical protein
MKEKNEINFCDRGTWHLMEAHKKPRLETQRFSGEHKVQENL